MNNGNSRKPTHRLKATGPQKDQGKNFWTTIGSGWQRDDGTISLTINDGLNLIFTKGTRLILAPVEEK
jgi:hypothetical protein